MSKTSKILRKLCRQTSVNPADAESRYKRLKADYAATPNSAKGDLKKTLIKAADLIEQSMKRMGQ